MTERYQIGPFHFTFANGRLWGRYEINHFGDRMRYTLRAMPADMTLAMHLHWFLSCRRDDKPYLSQFVRYYFPDILDIWADAERHERTAIAMPDRDYSVKGKK